MVIPADTQANEAGENEIDEQVPAALPESIQRYFDRLNQGEFERAAALFAEDGQLLPPLEKPIRGRAAITHYLSTEADGMTLTPLRCETSEPSAQTEEEPTVDFVVRGKVKTSLFVVNVAWQFSLNAADEITRVKIKLLAKLEELLKFKQ